MRHAPSTLHFSQAFRSLPTGAIEWEELPSLAPQLRQAAQPGRSTTPWDATRPAELERLPPSQPFRELQGVAIREVNEPDVFKHFFGR